MRGEGRRCGLAERWAGMLAVLAVMAVSACGGGPKIEVERTTTLPPEPAKATYVFVRAKGQDHARDYAKFADQIAGQLAAKGFSRVDSTAQARYALMFSYDGDGQRRGSEGGDSEESYRSRHGRDHDDGPEVSASIALFDLTRPNQPGEKVFGGWAQGPEGKEKDQDKDWAKKRAKAAARRTAVVAALIDAILKDFPGEASEDYSASLPDAD